MKNAVSVQILGEEATGQSESCLWAHGMGRTIKVKDFNPFHQLMARNATVSLSCPNLSLVTVQTSCFQTRRAGFAVESQRFGSGGCQADSRCVSFQECCRPVEPGVCAAAP